LAGAVVTAALVTDTSVGEAGCVGAVDAADVASSGEAGNSNSGWLSSKKKVVCSTATGAILLAAAKSGKVETGFCFGLILLSLPASNVAIIFFLSVQIGNFANLGFPTSGC
jgi:hypothetical protein